MIFWTERTRNELYVYCDGRLIYKRWYRDETTEKRQSKLFNELWPPVDLPR